MLTDVPPHRGLHATPFISHNTHNGWSHFSHLTDKGSEASGDQGSCWSHRACEIASLRQVSLTSVKTPQSCSSLKIIVIWL